MAIISIRNDSTNGNNTSIIITNHSRRDTHACTSNGDKVFTESYLSSILSSD